MAHIYLITGVNGIGKSSIIPFLQSGLTKNFEIHDFDERGVPDNADRVWRQSELRYWLMVGKGKLNKGVSTIICGFMKPLEIQNNRTDLNIPITGILLDANSEVITKRIFGRYPDTESTNELLRTTGKTPDEFAAGNVWISEQFRTQATEGEFKIIDTSLLTPEEVAQGIIKLL